MLGVNSKKVKGNVVWNIWAVCPYCKTNYQVDLSPGIEADTTLIPCYPCWQRYEENPINVPTDLLFATNLIEAEKILRKLWLDLDVTDPDFRYYKRFIRDNFS